MKKIVDLLNQRDISLYISCQLIDFYASLSMGGIATQAALENAGLKFAEYKTNSIKKNNGFWDAHVFHLMDYGALFYRKALNTPNIFGPILIYVKPDILLDANLVNISNVSVRSEHFNSDSHLQSISTDELNKLYLHPADSSFPEKTILKESLIENSSDMLPEVICHFDTPLIPFSYVSLVSVDHYIINNRQFQSYVDEMKLRAGFTFPLMRRYCPSSTAIHISSEIGKMLLKAPVTFTDILNSDDEQLRAWAIDLKSKNLSQTFEIYTQHLQKDTLLPIYEGEISADKIDKLSEIVRQKNQAFENMDEKDALLILQELANKDPKIANRIQSMQKSK